LEWHRSAIAAASLAERQWIRIRANQPNGAYDIYAAEAAIPDPEWPPVPFQELLRIAFKDRLVNTLEHAVIKRLRGLA
jgi:hypothetical protein